LSAPSGVLREATRIAFEAGRILHQFFLDGCENRSKLDGSPVTEADEAAERFIAGELLTLFPDVPLLAEEAAAAGRLPDMTGRFLCVDPMDGTSNFIGGDGQFTVNIAMISKGNPIWGVIDAPAIGALYVGEVGVGAWRYDYAPKGAAWDALGAPRSISVRPVPERPVLMESHGHKDADTAAFNAAFNPAQTLSAGSSLKFCRIAEGSADIYARLRRLAMWDIAAGHAIVNAAGGDMQFLDDPAFLYGQSDRDVSAPHFVAAGTDLRLPMLTPR
jgi:3'(2'), 5'-bisphosphate nucleotidase